MFSNNKNVSASKGATYYLFCQIIIRSLTFFSIPIFARLLTKEEFGAFSNYTAWIGVLYPIVTLNLKDSLYKSKYKYKNTQGEYLLSIILFANLFTVVFFVLIENNIVFFCKLFSLSPVIIRLMFVYIVFYTTYDFVKMILNVNREYINYTIYFVLTESFVVLLSIILIFIVDDKLYGRILGYTIPIVIINTVIFFYILFKIKRIKFEYIRYAIFLSVPLLPSSLSSIILVSSDRAMITYFWNEEQTALYQMGYSVALIVAMIWTALNQAFGPWFYDNLEKNNIEIIRNKTNLYITIYTIIILGVMFLTPEILLFMGGDSYNSALYIIPPVTLGMVAQFFYAFYYDIEYYYEKVNLLSVGTIFAGILNFVLNIVFIPLWGELAAAYTTLFGYFSLFFIHFFICKYKLKKEYLFDSKKIFFSMAFLFIAQLVIAFIYEYVLLRYCFFMFYLFGSVYFLIKNKDSIIVFIPKRFFKNNKTI